MLDFIKKVGNFFSRVFQVMMEAREDAIRYKLKRQHPYWD